MKIWTNSIPGNWSLVYGLSALIAAAQLAVDRQVEQGEVALPALKLKPNPDRRDLLRLERALLPD